MDEDEDELRQACEETLINMMVASPAFQLMVDGLMTKTKERLEANDID